MRHGKQDNFIWQRLIDWRFWIELMPYKFQGYSWSKKTIAATHKIYGDFVSSWQIGECLDILRSCLGWKRAFRL